jgi:hypothetical protein
MDPRAVITSICASRSMALYIIVVMILIVVMISNCCNDFIVNYVFRQYLKVLRPAISAQVFLGFPVPLSKC